MKHFEQNLAFDDPNYCEYRVQLLRDAVTTREGVVHRGDDGETLLPWSRVAFAIAATVGEPEGISTVVFDLLIERRESLLVVCRLDADPCAEALPLAAALGTELGPNRSDATLETTAKEGSPRAWYPDLESFEAAAIKRFLKR